MGNCTYCSSLILFGGPRDQTGHYCNAKCQQAGNLLALSQHIAPAHLERAVQDLHHSNCPRCGGPGPVDMHKAYKVWSALVLTSWSTSPALCCKGCATKRQWGAIGFSGLFGWWGFPWGIIMTPVQLVRNFSDMAGGPSSSQPSPLLEKVVRIQMATTMVQNRPAAVSIPPSLPGAKPPPLPTAAPAPASTPDNDERYRPKGD